MKKIILPEIWPICSLNKNEFNFPPWLLEQRKIFADKISQFGFPPQQFSRWKYANISSFLKTTYELMINSYVENQEKIQKFLTKITAKLSKSIVLVTVNGRLDLTLSDTNLLPDEIICCDLPTAFQQYSTELKLIWEKLACSSKMNFLHNESDYAFANLNRCSFTDGIFLQIPDHYKLDIPIHIINLTACTKDTISFPYHIISCGENSAATVIAEYVDYFAQNYFINSMVDLHIKNNAVINYIKLQKLDQSAQYFANLNADQDRFSNFNNVNFSAGAQFSREDLFVYLQAEGASTQSVGFYSVDSANQYLDYHVDILHKAAHTYSDMQYKGIIANNAKAVFNGRVYVADNAKGACAYQSNHNLLLHALAQVYAKPELEIYTQDVKCKHGATVGCLDEDAIFYLQTRGIDHDYAQKMLIAAFSAQIFNYISDQQLNNEVQKLFSVS